MKKILGLLIGIFITTLSVCAENLRFVQVDSVKLSAANEQSVNTFKKVINDINKQRDVEFVIFSGDNIANPTKENLDTFLKIANELNTQYYLALGSKDINKQKHMSKDEYMLCASKKSRAHKKILSSNYVIDKKDIVFVIVDGSRDVIPSPMGYYKKSTLDWLENQLSFYSNRNIVLFQHFPLIPPTKKESRMTVKPEEYLEILEKYNNVKAIFAGNFDANSEQFFNNILHVTTANAPQYRIVDIIDSNTGNPTFWSVIKE